MTQIQRCTRCLLPGSLSNVTFNADGVCNHCLKYEKDFSNWGAIAARKQQEFEKMIATARALRRPYDCLIPLSGGKDSTYTLYLCTRIYKLKCLTVTFDNGYLSNPAKENIHHALEATNADHFLYKINKDNARELFKTFVIKTGDFCNACMRGINYSIELATKTFKVPLVIKGSGRRVQYVSMISEVSSLNTPSYFANVLKGEKAGSTFRHFSRHRHSSEFEKIVGGLCDVLKIPRTALMRFVPQQIGIYDYFYKPYSEIIQILEREMGWKDANGTVEHLDCELHSVPFFMNTLRIPDISPDTFRNSGLIRQGILSRDEAQRIEDEMLKGKNPPRDLLNFLNQNGIQYEEYVHCVKNADKSRYEPKLQKIARDIYFKLRRF